MNKHRLNSMVESLKNRRIDDCSYKTVSELYSDFNTTLISFSDDTFWCSRDHENMWFHEPAQNCPLVLVGLVPVEAVIAYQKEAEELSRAYKLKAENAKIEKERKDWEQIHEFINQPAVTTTDLRDV